MIEQQLERIANALESISVQLAQGGGAAAAPAAPSTDDFLGGQTAAEEKYTTAQVIEITKEVASKVGKNKVIELIKTFDVSKASDIPEEKFAEFIAKLKKLEK